MTNMSLFTRLLTSARAFLVSLLPKPALSAEEHVQALQKMTTGLSDFVKKYEAQELAAGDKAFLNYLRDLIHENERVIHLFQSRKN